MNQELDYAEMLEIPVSTVTVTKKKSIFKRRRAAAPNADDIKERVVESVNERVGASVETEDLSDPPAEKKGFLKSIRGDRAGMVLFGEAIAIGVIAVAIFLTNVFMPHSAINSVISMFATPSEEQHEPAYSEFTLGNVVSVNSGAEVTVSPSGVLSFTAESSVYPICSGEVSKVYGGEDEGYMVEVSHTSTFTSVITGLSQVYAQQGTKVYYNLPVGYSDGTREVQVSMYDNGELLNCYDVSGAVPVWKK